MDDDRRKLLGILAVASFGIPLVACSSAQVTQLEATVTDAIQKVQAGVVSALQTTCSWAGKLVPQAQSVMQEITAALGNPVSVVLEGSAASAISLLTGAVQASIDAIAGGAAALCPPAPPGPAPTPAPTALAPSAPVKTAKGTVIRFY